MTGLNRRVSRERWLEAQAWEESVWTRREQRNGWRRTLWPMVGRAYGLAGVVKAADDWNHWWAEQFDDYFFLPSELGDVIELGCGPYTNVRLLLENRSARRVVCSDPLARRYVGYRGRWLAEANRRGRIEVDDHPIEALPFAARTFDLVVVVNVLDHVQDADRCLEVSTGLVRPGGFLLLGQDLSDEADAARFPDDVGHPIRLRREDVDPYLAALEPVLRKDLPREAGRTPEAHYATLVFAGRAR